MSEVAPRKRSRTRVFDELLKAVSGEIAPVRTTGSYRLGLVVVSFGMLLLPLLYLAFIALTIGGVVWHATANLSVMKTIGGIGGLAIYLIPLVVGGLLVAFMFKPFFAQNS